jgi:hypothetical protein
MHAQMPSLPLQNLTGQCAAGARTDAGGDEQARPGAGNRHKVSKRAAELEREPRRQRAARTGPRHVRLAAATQTLTAYCLCHAPRWRALAQRRGQVINRATEVQRAACYFAQE